MNKEVIYLEPEDDITDILTKLQRAEQKLVALVPPKKTTILRSAVNMKLIAKAAKENSKVAVLVTSDPAIMKLAMGAKIPVAKTLQSRPVVPTSETLQASEAEEQVIDEESDDLTAPSAKKTSKTAAKKPVEGTESASETSKTSSANTLELTDESLGDDPKSAKKGKKAHHDGKNGSKMAKLDKYRKWIIAGSVTGVLLICVLVWALVFAPAVSIVVAISTTSRNFSENVNFTTDLNAENLEENRFYVDEQSYEQNFTAEFTPTGRENKGERASGEVIVSLTFRARDFEDGLEFAIPSGAAFSTTAGESFTATESRTIRWANTNIAVCKGVATNLECTQSTTVPVKATSAGEAYNIAARSTWNSYTSDGLTASVTNSSAFTGGTTENVTVVSADDLNQVKDTLIAEHTAEGQNTILSDLPKDSIPIESSFKVEAVKTESSPAVGEEAKDNNAKASATITLKFAIYTVDRTRVEEYIHAKMELEDGQKIYDIGQPYFERFTSLEEPARLKTAIETGPTVTEEEILEQVKGRKIGEVQATLRRINGVSSVQITPSFFWVSSVPSNANKITIEMTVEDN